MSGLAYAYDHIVRARALNAAQQLKVLALVWDKGPEMDGWVFLPWIPGWCKDKAQRRANWNEGPAFKWPQDEAKILRHLEAHKQDDLYFTPNTFLGESRIAQFTGEEKVLYADLDEVNPTTDIDRDLRPTIAWETSPDRFQAVWMLSDFADGATEAGGLNHRLTSMLGADSSGWDTTQLLRVPGRRNFKPGYKDDEGDSPPGKLLWVTSARFDVEVLNNRLPKVEVYATGGDIEDHEIDRVDYHEVWGRVRLKVSHTVRTYMAMRSRNITEEHDRSEVLWQIERDLADAGCTVAEIVAIVRSTPWNKHEGRNNEMAQLKAEAAKAIGVSLADQEERPLESDEAEAGVGFTSLPTFAEFFASSIPKPTWLVNNIWAAGSVGFISGAPKSYKSYFGLDLAVSVATGKPFLNDDQFRTGKPRHVIYVQEEDSAPIVRHRGEQVIEGKAPEAYYKGWLTREGDDIMWEPPTSEPLMRLSIRRGFLISSGAWQSRLAEIIEENGTALVVIDTLGTTLGDVELNDSVKMNERVLKPLKIISEAAGCAIAIVHHNKKSVDTGGRLGQQMLGSVAMHAWVESALYVSSKEKLTNNPMAEVKVERENKLAEDLKFRVRVPVMYEDKGEGDSTRQLWAPEIHPGWGDADTTPEGDPEIEREDKRPTRAGKPIVALLNEVGARYEYVSFDDICAATTKRPGHLKGELNRAVGNDLVLGSMQKGFKIK